MQALQFWKAVASDEANMLESLVGLLDLADIARILEAYPDLRARVPEEVLGRLMS